VAGRGWGQREEVGRQEGESERVPQIGDGGEVPSIEGMERGF
jgi:hypothetical protein